MPEIGYPVAIPRGFIEHLNSINRLLMRPQFFHPPFSAVHWQKTAVCQYLLAPPDSLFIFAVTFDVDMASKDKNQPVCETKLSSEL